MIDCFNDWLLQYEWKLYFKTIILLSDEISTLWGECRPGVIFSPGPGFDSRHWQPVDTQGQEILFIIKLKQSKQFNSVKSIPTAVYLYS